MFFFSFYFFKTLLFDEFSFEKVAEEAYLDERFSLNSLSEEQQRELRGLLKGEYRFLSQGRQTFVFSDKEEKIVLKLFNCQRFSLPSLIKGIPLFKNYYERKIRKKKEKLDKYYFHSYQLAYEKFKEESGLIYVNFSTNPLLRGCFIEILSSSGKRKQIDLSKTPFILQKKTESFADVLLNESSSFRRHHLLEKLLLSIKKRCELLLGDDDLNIEKNYGILNDQIIVFDVGRLYAEPLFHNHEVKQKGVRRSIKRFRRWLKKHCPDEWEFFEEKAKELTNS